jgi:hypothetical protein
VAVDLEAVLLGEQCWGGRAAELGLLDAAALLADEVVMVARVAADVRRVACPR